MLQKDPVDHTNYEMDWSTELRPGEDILTSEWPPVDGLTLDQPDKTTSATSVWVAGGTSGEMYYVPNVITTSHQRTLRRSLMLLVLDQLVGDE